MKKFIGFIGITAVLFSCQKVIDVDLNEANQNVVINAAFTAEDSTVRVKISLTSSYFNSEASDLVNSATVSITDGNGLVQNIPSLGNGTYELTNYIPVFGTTYQIDVLYAGQTYAASCKLHTPVAMEEPGSLFIPSYFGSDSGYVAVLNINDPAGVENYYQVILSKNGVKWDKLTDYITQDDQLTDGNPISRPLFAREFYNVGDSIGMELRTIDKVVYNYINQAISTVNSQASAAPANPTSNWSNKALGYFTAYGISEGGIIVTE